MWDNCHVLQFLNDHGAMDKTTKLKHSSAYEKRLYYYKYNNEIKRKLVNG